MRVLLAALLACADPEPQLRACEATITCDATSSTTAFQACVTEAQASDRVDAWLALCGELTGFYGCGDWYCEMTCRATGEVCP